MQHYGGKMKYLHIMPDSVYSKDFSEKTARLYGENEHLFLIHQWDGNRSYDLKKGILVQKADMLLFVKIMYWIFVSQKVILHSLYLDKRMYILFSCLSVIQKGKFIWVIWSADLYNAHDEEIGIRGFSPKKRLRKYARETIIRNLRFIVGTEGDYLMAKKWYKTKAQLRIAEYTYNLMDLPERQPDVGNRKIKILAGHSAVSTCNHEKMFWDLSRYSHDNVEIISILSYPANKSYIEKVIAAGKKTFGDAFIPVTEWMSPEKYREFLNRIDIAVLDSTCQKAAGNIVYLLYFGKKVYLSPENSNYDHFLNQGITVFSTLEIGDKSFFEPLTTWEINENKKKLKEIYSDSGFQKKWDKVFYE